MTPFDKLLISGKFEKKHANLNEDMYKYIICIYILYIYIYIYKYIKYIYICSSQVISSVARAREIDEWMDRWIIENIIYSNVLFTSSRVFHGKLHMECLSPFLQSIIVELVFLSKHLSRSMHYKPVVPF